jgi:hypothetical protein
LLVQWNYLLNATPFRHTRSIAPLPEAKVRPSLPPIGFFLFVVVFFFFVVVLGGIVASSSRVQQNTRATAPNFAS